MSPDSEMQHLNGVPGYKHVPLRASSVACHLPMIVPLIEVVGIVLQPNQISTVMERQIKAHHNGKAVITEILAQHSNELL